MSIIEKLGWAVAAATLAACSPGVAEADNSIDYHVIPGSFEPGSGRTGTASFSKRRRG